LYSLFGEIFIYIFRTKLSTNRELDLIKIESKSPTLLQEKGNKTDNNQHLFSIELPEVSK
jgi:hypothetical protein